MTRDEIRVPRLADGVMEGFSNKILTEVTGRDYDVWYLENGGLRIYPSLQPYLASHMPSRAIRVGIDRDSYRRLPGEFEDLGHQIVVLDMMTERGTTLMAAYLEALRFSGERAQERPPIAAVLADTIGIADIAYFELYRTKMEKREYLLENYPNVGDLDDPIRAFFDI